MLKKSLSVVSTIILLLFILLTFTFEWYLRKKAEKCVVQIVEDRFNAHTEVNIKSRLFLFDILRKHLTGIDITTNSKFQNLTNVRASLKDIKMRSFTKAAQIGNIQATIIWPNDEITRILNSKIPSFNASPVVAGVSRDQANGGIRIEFIGGLAFLVVKPYIHNNNKINFEVLVASAFGFDLPKDKVQQVISVLTNEIGTIPDNLRINSVVVKNEGIEIHITGSQVPVDDRLDNSNNISNCT